jgi:copper oxidase (laccase) domain-containing protein
MSRAGRDVVEAFAGLKVTAFTTTRQSGDFGVPADGPTAAVRAMWEDLLSAIDGADRIVSSRQVHGRIVLTHDGEWDGWLRLDGADGHVTLRHGTAVAVSVADCVPVFLAHPSGAVGVLHAGWRGVVAGMLDAGLDAMQALGAPPDETHVHLGPAISGRQYEVGVEVYQ